MAEDAVAIVDLASALDVFAKLVRTRLLERPEGVLSLVEIDPLVVNRDVGRRCRMDRPREERRLERKRSSGRRRSRPRAPGWRRPLQRGRCVPLLCHEPDEGAERPVSRRSWLEDTYARIAIETIPM